MKKPVALAVPANEKKVTKKDSSAKDSKDKDAKTKNTPASAYVKPPEKVIDSEL